MWSEVKWSEVKWRSEVKKWSEVKQEQKREDNCGFLEFFREAIKKMDGLSPTYLKPPPPPPSLKMDYVFFSPLFYRSFPNFRHNFYIKSKKTNMKSGLSPRPPPSVD